MTDRAPDYPHYRDGTPCAQGDAVVLLRPQPSNKPYVNPHTDSRIYTGTVQDHELTPDGDVEVLWDHTDTSAWWPANRLRPCTADERAAR